METDAPIQSARAGSRRTATLLRSAMAVLAVAVPASAQSAASLDLQLHAGVGVTGAVGAVYEVQYVTDLAQTNNAGSWRLLEFLQLPTTRHLWVDVSRPAQEARFYRAVQREMPTNLVFIPPSKFRRGSPAAEQGAQNDEKPQSTVTISHGFWMGKFEVTQAEFLDVMGSNPSSFTGDLSRPVESVSWIEATNYCAKLTQRELAAGRIPAGSQFRLPTEAEWEYAARAWTTTQFHYGDDPQGSQVVDYAWTGDNSGFKAHPVGQKKPNPWGLYDMTGNVWEWCQDWYGSYTSGFQTDPQGPAESTGTGLGSYKVMRGGGFDYGAMDCRSARRLIFAPNLTDYDLGFRVVLAPVLP